MTHFRILFATLIILGLSESQTHAYPTFHRLGYISCSACHHLPTGGGPLTQYGLGVSDELSAFKPSKVRESTDPPPWLSPLLMTRVMTITTDQGTSAFLMQADLAASAAIGEKFRADATVGLGLRRGSDGEFVTVAEGANAVVLRRALLGYTHSETLSFQAGRDLLPSGLNIDDHTAFIRSLHRKGPLDYPTQIRSSITVESLNLMPYVFAPSIEESAAAREWGGGLRAEYALGEMNSVGVTFLGGATPAITRFSFGAFSRLSLHDWNGLITEYIRVQRTLDSGIAFGQDLFYFKPYVALPGWLESGISAEVAHTETPFFAQTFRIGPSLRARLRTSITLGLDVQNVSTRGRESEWGMNAQLFLWL